MPYVYVYECASCGWDAEITLSREFRLDSRGARVPYEYPPPGSSGLIEWPPKRVSGIRSELWCPACRSVRELVLVELDEPAEHPVQAFLAAEARGLRGSETGPCPACGAELRVEAEGQPCPACGTGHLRCVGEYEP